VHFEHTRLLVSNFAECFQFYRDVLGLAVTWGDESGSYASFNDGHGARVSLALFVRQPMADVVGTGRLPRDAFCQDHFMLIAQVEDVDATVAELRERGVQFAVGPQDFPDWGIRSAYIRDPAGNLIELSSSLDPALWSEGLRADSQKYAPS
jgi:catechol 2,3-dioxygenase-like lactoylglutathione lyase family enzyme